MSALAARVVLPQTAAIVRVDKQKVGARMPRSEYDVGYEFLRANRVILYICMYRGTATRIVRKDASSSYVRRRFVFRCCDDTRKSAFPFIISSDTL